MPKLQEGLFVYDDRPLLTTAAHDLQKPLSNNKSVPGTRGLYHIMDIASHITTIDKNMIHNTISIDRGAQVQNVPQQKSL